MLMNCMATFRERLVRGAIGLLAFYAAAWISLSGTGDRLNVRVPRCPESYRLCRLMGANLPWAVKAQRDNSRQKRPGAEAGRFSLSL
jgi:hypothetical protein